MLLSAPTRFKQDLWRKILLSLLILNIAAPVIAQPGNKELDKWLNNHVREMGGRLMLVIYKDGKYVYSKALNKMTPRQKITGRIIARRMDREPNVQNFSLTTRQPIASCSKWLSAALVMTFVDEGKLNLSDTVGKYLPILSQQGKGHITISHCLSHLTGINAGSLRESLDDMKNVHTMDESIEQIAKLPMEGEPGKVFHYSNAGLQIAGAVIEKISGKSFETLFAERIARPLQMKNTDFGKAEVPLPAGGAGSTPQDYMNFLIMILNKGTFNGKRILSEQSIAQMQVNRITPDVRIAYSPAGAGNFGYGYGEWVMKNTDAATPAESVSSPGLSGSFPWVDNEKQYCGFLFTFYLKNQGRNERYKEVMELAEKAVQ